MSRNSSQQSKNATPSTDNYQEYYDYQPIYAAANESIVPGIQFVEEEHYHDKLGKYLEWFEWENWMYMIHDEEYYPDLIVQFYQNAIDCTESESDPIIESCVQGKCIQLNCETLASIFNIPNAGQKVFFKQNYKNHVDFEDKTKFWHTILSAPHGPTRVKQKELKPEFFILNKFINNNILPKGGHTGDVTGLACFIMHCFATRNVINLPYLILKYMLLILKDNQSPKEKGKCRILGYGRYLTRIFRHVKLNLDIPTAPPEAPYGWLDVKNAYKCSNFKLKIKSCVDEQENEDVETVIRGRSYHRTQYDEENITQEEGTSNAQNFSQPTMDIGDYSAYAQYLQNDYSVPNYFGSNQFGNSGY